MDECDAWVVIENLPTAQAGICPPERTIFLTHEPPAHPRYPAEFVAQFGSVITSHDFPGHRNVIRHQPGITWWVGVRMQKYTALETILSYDSLVAMPQIEKSRDISVICSNVDFLASHRRRIRFVERLREHFKDRIDFFGEGWRPIPDKWDAIAPYRYHIAIENSPWPDYWTEKLSDTFLAGALPIYGGCPNIAKYFDPESIIAIDIRHPDRAIQIIEHALANNEYEKRRELVWQSRQRVLYEHNFFPMIASICRKLPRGVPSPIKLEPIGRFPFSLKEKLMVRGFKASQNLARVAFRTQRRLFGSPLMKKPAIK